jgi:acetyl-CoA carboxylase carboxyltransferase component
MLIEKILDPNSFVELGALVRDAEVVCGYGTIHSRLVYLYEQTGFVTAVQGEKVAATYRAALKVGAPVIGVLNAEGMRLPDGLDCMESYGHIFQAIARSKGQTPLIAAVSGGCMGISAWIAQMSDFLFLQESSRFFFMSPNTYPPNTPPAAYQDLVHVRCPDGDGLAAKLRELFLYIPSNRLDAFVTETDDSPNREEAVGPGDLLALVASLADRHAFFELMAGYTNAHTCLCKCFGHPLGVVAARGELTGDALRKMSGFVSFCAAFRVPLLTLADVTGFAPGDEAVIREGARLIETLARAQTPKLALYVGQNLGGAYLLMNSGHIGADLVYAWPEATFGLLNHEAEARVTGVSTALSPQDAGAAGYVDDIIHPAATRKRIAAALEMLAGKSNN